MPESLLCVEVWKIQKDKPRGFSCAVRSAAIFEPNFCLKKSGNKKNNKKQANKHNFDFNSRKELLSVHFTVQMLTGVSLGFIVGAVPTAGVNQLIFE